MTPRMAAAAAAAGDPRPASASASASSLLLAVAVAFLALFSPAEAAKDVVSLPPVKPAELNASATFARDTVARLSRLESSLEGAGIRMHHGTATHGQLIESMPEHRALEQGREALSALKASMYLSQHHCQKYGIDELRCARWLITQKLSNTPLGGFCARARAPHGEPCRGGRAGRYRTLDGSCNHGEHPAWGQAFTAYRRLLFPAYDDGLHIPRGPKKGLHLPSARLISSTIARDRDQPDRALTLAMMQWTQFVEHDLAHTPSSKMVITGTAMSCCRPDGSPLAPRHAHPLCQPVAIPSDDPFFARSRTRCMSYIRSLLAFRPDCNYGPAEQMNQATHFLDGSQLYGTSLNKERSLREFNGGKLILARKLGRDFLPPTEDPRERCQVSSDSRPCYKSGDVRANMHPHLATMHTLWAREHNRVAGRLADLNPHWGDETLYHEARRIVVGEMQVITYDQWLPILLGSRFAHKIGLASSDDDFSDQYRENMDPSVSNEFATAGLRFMLSMMQGRINLYDEKRKTNSSLLLRNHFNKPHVLEDELALDGLVRGLATQSSQQVDVFLVEDLTNLLYRDTSELGMDALSLDIQRGRDHGLPGYSQYRKLCGLPAARTFDDFEDVIPRHTVDRLKSVYAHPDDVDLVVGAMAETPREGALVGPTLRCIVSEQLLRSKRADRHFYDNSGQPYPFTADQLHEIRKSSLARIFCDNADAVNMMQPDVFSTPSLSNDLVPCSDTVSIPQLDLTQWRENFV